MIYNSTTNQKQEPAGSKALTGYELDRKNDIWLDIENEGTEREEYSKWTLNGNNIEFNIPTECKYVSLS